MAADGRIEPGDMLLQVRQHAFAAAAAAREDFVSERQRGRQRCVHVHGGGLFVPLLFLPVLSLFNLCSSSVLWLLPPDDT